MHKSADKLAGDYWKQFEVLSIVWNIEIVNKMLKIIKSNMVVKSKEIMIKQYLFKYSS